MVICRILGHLFEGTYHGGTAGLVCRRCGKEWMPAPVSTGNERERNT